MKINELNTQNLNNICNKSHYKQITETTRMGISNKLNTNLSSSEIINIRHPEYSNTDNHIRKLNIEDNKQIHIVFSENDSKISSRLVTKDGESVIITTENCPVELSKIKNLETLDKFLENAFAKVSNLSDGTLKLYIVQKCRGGMNDGLNFEKKISDNTVISVSSTRPSFTGSGNFSAETRVGVNVNPSSMPSSNFGVNVNHNINFSARNASASKPTFGISAKFKF